MATSPIYPSGVASIAKTIVPGDSTNYVDVYDNSGGSTPVRVEALAICSDDTSTVNISFAIYKSSVAYLIGTVRAVTLSGTDGAAARIDALALVGALQPDGIRALYVAPGEKLQAKSLVAVTSAKTVTISGFARLYA